NLGSSVAMRSRAPTKDVLAQPKVTPLTVVGYAVVARTAVDPDGSLTKLFVLRKSKPCCHWAAAFRLTTSNKILAILQKKNTFRLENLRLMPCPAFGE